MRRRPTDIDGRHERFLALYTSTCPQIVAYALRRTTSAEGAADVVAETFAVAWRRLDQVPEGDAGLFWCYATARRVLANLHRSSRRRAQVVERIGAHLASHWASTEGDPQSVAAHLALRRLSEDDRELLMLSGWEGLSSAQLACVLGCSSTAARIRLHRARSRLAATMAEVGLAPVAEKQRERQGHSPICPPEHRPATEAP